MYVHRREAFIFIDAFFIKMVFYFLVLINWPVFIVVDGVFHWQ